MNIVYYSHTKNTENFVLDKLIPQMRLMPVAFPGDDNPRAVIEGPNPVRIVAPGPHQPAYKRRDGIVGVKQPGLALVVFPIYARKNYETGDLEDTVPRCIKDYISAHPGEIVAGIGVGNRTFGSNFGAVNAEELGVPYLGAVELAGTRQETVMIVNKYNDLAKEILNGV